MDNKPVQINADGNYHIWNRRPTDGFIEVGISKRKRYQEISKQDIVNLG